MPKLGRAPARRSVAERNRLVEDNLRLVGYVLGWFQRRRPHVLQVLSEDDARQVAYLALIRAADAYDAGRCKFSTLAVVAIRHAVEQASAMRNQRLQFLVAFSSIGATTRREAESWQPEARPEPDALEVRERREAVRRALRTLPERLRQAVTLYWLEDRTLTEVGQALGGITRERARQLVQQGLERLRERLVVETASP